MVSQKSNFWKKVVEKVLNMCSTPLVSQLRDFLKMIGDVKNNVADISGWVRRIFYFFIIFGFFICGSTFFGKSLGKGGGRGEWIKIAPLSGHKMF